MAQTGQKSHDSGCCMFIIRGNTRCDASFVISGRGTIDVEGSFTPGVEIIGGTGDFRNVRGEATIVGGSAHTARFVFSMLP